MKTIIWDVDDVLNDLMRVWFEMHWRPAHPQCRLSYNGISANPPHLLLEVSLSEYLNSLDGFRHVHAAELAPRPAVLSWFRQYGERFRHIALTATPLSAAEISAAWVIKHFGPWIRSFNFVPSPREGERLPVYDCNKREFLRWLGKPAILVDDNPEHAAAAARQGLEAVLMPRPWNQSQATTGEVLQYLAQRAEG